MTMKRVWIGWLMASGLCAAGDLEKARDRQDRAALEKNVEDLNRAAQQSPNDPEAHYRLALGSSYLAEVALELRDKVQAQHVAEAGVLSAERAIALRKEVAEYYRVLGTLCGQVVPANVLTGLSYARRAREAINKALELDPKSSKSYLARGIGNYYVPPALGGGAELAIRDFERALELDAKSAEAYLWLGLGMRKANRNAEARKAFARSLELDPERVWARQQLEKTPPQ
jgi:tetratricopeptide (TPR) repeat protein